MNKAQLLQGITQIQLRLLGRLLLDTPEDIAPPFAAALLRLRLEHETMPDRRRAELVELVALLDQLERRERCNVTDNGERCELAADVVLERPTDIGRQVKACCAAHAQALLELPGEHWSRGVAP